MSIHGSIFNKIGFYGRPWAVMVKRSTSPKSLKGESINIRVTPKIKFGLELLARKQHRSLTSVIEWMVDNSLQDELFDRGRGESMIEVVWDPDPIHRLANLGSTYPSLLTYEEEVLWKAIMRLPDLLWSVPDGDKARIEEIVKNKGKDFSSRFLRFEVLSKFWNELIDFANSGDADPGLWDRMQNYVASLQERYSEVESEFKKYMGYIDIPF